MYAMCIVDTAQVHSTLVEMPLPAVINKLLRNHRVARYLAAPKSLAQLSTTDEWTTTSVPGVQQRRGCKVACVDFCNQRVSATSGYQ